MRLRIVAGLVAIALFIGYFAPMMIKLKEPPLALVLLGGIVLVAIDLWESLRN
jgi:hypothetical protein